MLSKVIVCFALFAAAPAGAETLLGSIDDPSLRRKIDLVYLESVPGKFAPPETPPVVNQRGNVYLPHLIAVVSGTKVVFQSEDPELHNVYARGTKKVLFNDAVLPRMKTERVFNDLGPVHLSCNIHKEMSAWVMVLQNPFFTRPDKTGKFTILGVPPGSYTLRIWGENLDDEQNSKKFTVTVGGPSGPLKIASR